MHSSLIALAAPVALSLGLLAAPAAAAEPSSHTVAEAAKQAATQTPTETLAERQQRVALELEAENLLVTLHHKPLEAELEPCINSAVSPSGRFASAEIEHAVERLASGELTEHLGNSAYFRAFNDNDGRIALTD